MEIESIQRALQKLGPDDQPGLFLLAPDGLRVCMPGTADWKPVTGLIDDPDDDEALRKLLSALVPGVKLTGSTLNMLRFAAKALGGKK